MENASAATHEVILVKCQGKGSVFDFFEVIQIFKWGSSTFTFLSVTLEKVNKEFLIDESESHSKNHMGLFFRMMTFTETISQVFEVWMGDISFKTSLLHVFNSKMLDFFPSTVTLCFFPHYFLFLSMALSVTGYLFTCKLC